MPSLCSQELVDPITWTESHIVYVIYYYRATASTFLGRSKDENSMGTRGTGRLVGLLGHSNKRDKGKGINTCRVNRRFLFRLKAQIRDLPLFLPFSPLLTSFVPI
jgi:hypothetical protein